ncbi:hypothetical protein C0992_009528, partial [Termitomyces sp. T32_za158]
PDGLSPSSSPKTVSSPIGLPSPVPSTVEPLSPPSSSHPTPSAPIRKRRLSDSGTQGARTPDPPRPVPHTQTASDALSIPSALFDDYSSTPFDGWFEQSFELPNVFDGTGGGGGGGGGGDLTGFDFEFGLHAEASSSDDTQALETAVQLNLPHRETSAKDITFGDVQSLWADASSSFNSDASAQGERLHAFFQASMLTPTLLVPVPPLPASDFDLMNHISGFYPPSASAIDSSSDSTSASAARSCSLSHPDFSWGFLDPLGCDRAFGIAPGKPLLLVPEDCSGLLAAGSSYPTRPLEQAVTRADKIMRLLRMREDALRLELELATT